MVISGAVDEPLAPPAHPPHIPAAADFELAKSSSRHAQIQLLDEMFSGALLACCEHGIRGMPRCYESASTPKQGGGSGLCPRRGRSFDENPHFDSPAQSILF